ncbi:D-alanyl-D-alanine carboxypeptidase family protein [Candidatus Saccharibacteria bacterium]|nr:D-alanyl-D-alanine carboxypeptidase family protein [Candidatus Saccharibacteria bacterium]MCB9821177.1 D-alanyl-D-alanine carboxypeptidase family protein [Candidatus Nomurabacteria bacterium]
MTETYTVDKITPEEFSGRWSSEELSEANAWIISILSQPDNKFAPTYSKTQLLAMLDSHPHAARIFQDVLLLEKPQTGTESPIEIFADVPPDAAFAEIQQAYVGADGKYRQPNTKFMPRHTYSDLLSLQANCNQYIVEQISIRNWPERPGIIIDSGYRSPSYQAITLLRAIVEYGLGDALKRCSVPGSSQHSDYRHPAVDFMIIGDQFGKLLLNPQTGYRDNVASFEQSLEFEALLKFGPDCGYWLPYHPNPDNPLSTISHAGIIYEPWHWQYLGNPEEAHRRMVENQVYESIAARKQALAKVA